MREVRLTADRRVAIGLSKSVRDAVLRLASERETELMKLQLSERLAAEHDQIGDGDGVVFEYEPEPEMDWSEGVEHLRSKTEDDMYKMLGLGSRIIPLFRQKLPVEGDVAGNLVEMESNAAVEENFRLRWHQLVGLTRMLERSMSSEPVLLMDDVGLGKTVQVIALFAMLAYYRDYYAKFKEYPPIWGKRCYLEWNGRRSQMKLTHASGREGVHQWTSYAKEKGPLPKSPFLFVVPPSLVDQVTDECNRFLEPGGLDVVKITGSYVTHKSVWNETDTRSKVEKHNRIYVMSTTVSTDLHGAGAVANCRVRALEALQSDFSHVYHHIGSRMPKKWRIGIDENTVFGRRYLGVAVDEAHGFRNANKLFSSVRALRGHTDILVAMTATPVQTRPAVSASDNTHTAYMENADVEA